MAQAETDAAAGQGERIVAELVAIGERLELDVVKEHPVPGGRIDVVWSWSPNPDVTAFEGPFLLAGFEVESSWRTRKYVKGDYLNLLDLGAAIGVIVLAGSDDPRIPSLRQFARRMVARPGPRVLVWSEEDVETLASQLGGAGSQSRGGSPRAANAPVRPVREHPGKYRPLWRWLSEQSAAELTLSFDEVEEVLGFSLPSSCRVHHAHWHGYEGSAVARAIADAGWTAAHVNLEAERVMLTPA